MENRKTFVITSIVFVLIILGLVGFIVYDKFILNNEEEKYDTIINDVSVDVNGMLKIGKILNTLDLAYNDPDSNYFGAIYKTKIVDSKDYDIKSAIFVALYNNMIRSNTERTISNAVIKKEIKNIFGSDLKYTPSGIDAGNNIRINYNELNKSYTYTANIPTGSLNKYYVRNTKTNLKQDTVVVTRKMFYTEITGNNAVIYTDSQKTSKIGDVTLRSGSVDTKEVISKYGSKLNTYEYTFKYDLDEYYLYRVERVG